MQKLPYVNDASVFADFSPVINRSIHWNTYFRQTILYDDINGAEGLASLPRHIEKVMKADITCGILYPRGIQKALDLKRGCMAKSLLHKELQMFPNVPVRKTDQDSKYLERHRD